MAGEEDLNKKLNDFIQSLKDEGIMDDEFDHIRSFQTEKQPKYVTEMIVLYQNRAEQLLAEYPTKLNAEEVDYHHLTWMATSIYQGASRFGLARLAKAAQQLIAESYAEEKPMCREVFEEVTSEYATAKENLNKISEMEKAIYAESRGN